jgi:hypothetical protein
MALTGSLNMMSVSDVLQFLAVGQKTGLMKFSHGKVVKGIYFESGKIVGSSTNDPREYLGQVLIHYGKIDETQLKAAMEAQRGAPRTSSGGGTSRKDGAPKAQQARAKRLGQILVDQGIVTEADIRQVLEIRTLEIIYDLFIWTEGYFEFCVEDPLPPDFTRVSVDPTKVIMEGVYRADELARYRTLIPSDRTVMELGAGWTSSLGIGKATRQLLYYLEKRMSVAEICYSMHASPFEVYAQLYDLVQKGLAHVAGELPPTADATPSIGALSGDSAELLVLAREELQKNNAENAMTIVHEVLLREPNDTTAQKLLDEAENKFIQQVYTQIPAQGVPTVVIQSDELSKKEIEPQEGFVLSRINGEWDIQSILSICPFREADSLRMIKKLWDQGIIGF